MDKKHEEFNRLLDSRLGMLRAAAFRILANPDDADEAIQNALLKAWQKYGSFRSEAQLSSWVYRVTLNESFELLRQRRREKKKLTQFSSEQPAETSAPEQPDERLEKLRISIAALPGLYRDAITAGVLNELPAGDAAALLDCTVNTLYQRIHKAKQLLKNMMEGGAQ